MTNGTYYTCQTQAPLVCGSVGNGAPEWAQSLDGLVSGLPPLKRPTRDFAMLQCFVDESGTDDGPILVLAGFVADVETWKAFSAEWQECLDMRPRMKRFHMVEAWAEWGDEIADRVTRFHRIIDNHAMAGVSAALPIEPYQRLFADQDGWKDPYVYLLFQYIRAHRQHCDRMNLDRKVKFIFDRQKGAAPRIAEAWEFFEQKGNERVREVMGGAPSFESSYDFLPLQAADMMAWWLRRQMVDRLEGLTPPKMPWKIQDSVPGLALRINEEQLRRDRVAMFQANMDVFDLVFPLRERRSSGEG